MGTTVRHCDGCGGRTPHGRRSLRWTRVLGWAAFAGALACLGYAVLAPEPGALVAGILLGGGAFAVRGPDRPRRIACDRCREKRLAELRAARTGRPGFTIRDFF